MNDISNKILCELKKVIAGKDDILNILLAAVFAGGHILIEDLPGTGKTTMALALSKAMGLDFCRIQLTPDTMAGDITGYSAFDSAAGEFRFHKGAAFTDLLLADELNRTSGKTQAALLEAMEEGHCTVDGVTYELPGAFTVIATQNPSGTAGTWELPVSQLDRFAVRIRPGSPDRESLKRLLKERQCKDPMESVCQVCTARDLREIRHECGNVFISEPVYDYICDLWEKISSEGKSLSPRGVLWLCRVSKAAAYISGRDYVVPRDVRDCFEPVCAHRLGVSSPESIEAILRSVSSPEIKGKGKA